MRDYVNEDLSATISGEDGKRLAIVKYTHNGDLDHIIEYGDDGHLNCTGIKRFAPGTFTAPIGENLDELKRYADNMRKSMARFSEMLKEKCVNN